MSRTFSLTLAGLATVLSAAPLASQSSNACNVQLDFDPRRGSSVALLHPASIQRRYATLLARREWRTVVGALRSDVDTVFARLSQAAGDTAFRVLSDTLERAIDGTVAALFPVLDLPLSQRAAALRPLEIGKYEPVISDGVYEILPRQNGLPVAVFRDSLSLEEYEAICWASRSMERLLSAINSETLPAAMQRINVLAAEWERYRADGPMQLPHELALNRLWRFAFGGRSEARYNPPRVDLIALHPFGGVEVGRRDGALKRNESLALEAAGFTVWFNDWRNHVGLSWILAYDSEGRVGRGPLVHLSGYLAAGAITRRDAAGVRRTALILSIDALRVLNPDDAAQLQRQTRGIAGKLLSSRTAPP